MEKSNLLNKINEVELETDDVKVSKSILTEIIKSSFLTSIRNKSNLNRYFITEGILFIALNKPNLKKLSDTEKQEKKSIYKVQITNFLKLKKACLKRHVKAVEVTEINLDDLKDFGISQYKRLNQNEINILQEIEQFVSSFNELIKTSNINKTLDFLKVL